MWKDWYGRPRERSVLDDPAGVQSVMKRPFVPEAQSLINEPGLGHDTFVQEQVSPPPGFALDTYKNERTHSNCIVHRSSPLPSTFYTRILLQCL
jgi:hypothetical protein